MKLIFPQEMKFPLVTDVHPQDVQVIYHHAYMQKGMVRRIVTARVELSFGAFGVEMTSSEAERLGIQLIKGAL